MSRQTIKNLSWFHGSGGRRSDFRFLSSTTLGLLALIALAWFTPSLLQGADAKPATPAAAPAAPVGSWEFTAQELAMPQGKPNTNIPEEMRRMFKVVDDNDAKAGKALQVTVDKRIIREKDIPILRTPGISRKDAPVGLYKVTVRMKLTGMLNVIGTAIRFDAKDSPPTYGRGGSPSHRYEEPTIHGYMFKDADVYQEFSFVTEVIEPDHVSQRISRDLPLNGLGSAPPPKAELDKLAAAAAPTPEEAKAEAQKVAKARQNAENIFRNSNLSVELQLLTALTKGFGRARNSIQALTIDTIKIQRLPDPTTATVRQVLPQKIRLHPGEEQVFHVWLHNRSGKTQTGDLHLQVVHGLANSIDVTSKPLTIENGKYAVVDVPWTSPKEDLWGCEVTAEFIQDGKPQSSAIEYFTVHSNPWAVMNFGGANRNKNPYFDPPDYRNHIEFFGVTPGDGIKPFPDDPTVPYFTGMSNYMTHPDHLKRLVAHNHSIGVSTFMYLFPDATSHLAEQAYLAHPEWFGNRINWTDMANDLWTGNTAEMMKRWTEGKRQPGGTDADAYKFYHIEAHLNDYFDEVFQGKVDGVLKCLKYIGYDGVRWDGDPFSVSTGEFAGHKFGTGSTDTDVALVAKRVDQFKAAIRKEFPGYTEGANGIMGVLAARSINRKLTMLPIESNPPFCAFLKDGSSIMDEGWMSAYGFTDPRNIIKDYFWGARQQVDACRRAGGFLHTFSPQRDGTPYFTQTIIYYNHLVALAGCQYPGNWSCSPGSETGLAQFLTRYSEFLWDNKLMWLKDAGQKIRVEAPSELWWEEETVYRDLPDGKLRYVIPLVNPPTVDRFMRDQFSELPEPVKEPFAVEVKVPAGFKDAKVYMLSAEPRTSCTPLEATVDSGSVKFEVPNLVIYRVIVVEFEK